MIKNRDLVNIVKSHRVYIAFVSFAIIGSLLILVSRAETPYVQTEIENSILSNGATKLTDSNASGGNAVVFNSATSTGFVHPGIFVSKQQLDFVKSKVTASQIQQPWKAAFDQLRSPRVTTTGVKIYTPAPVPELLCSKQSLLDDAAKRGLSYPQAGCTSLNKDSTEAYAQALLWYYTGDIAYANNAKNIINAWSSTLTRIAYDQPRYPSGGGCCANEQVYWQNLLITGWSAQVMTRAAEIIRYSDAGWQSSDIAKAESMFKNIYYPLLGTYTAAGSANGGQTWAESLVNIGVFTNDKTIYDRGIKWWKGNVKANVYLSRDGAQPAYPTNWDTGALTYIDTPSELKTILWRMSSTSSYTNGQQIETCRDMGHTYMGLGGMSNVAETAKIQGLDLYNDPEFKDRFIDVYELNSRYVNEMLDEVLRRGYTSFSYTALDNVSDSGITPGWMPTNWICPDFKSGGSSSILGTEVMYNHYANRMGMSLPNTKKLVERTRPSGIGLHGAFETLTSAGTP